MSRWEWNVQYETGQADFGNGLEPSSWRGIAGTHRLRWVAVMQGRFWRWAADELGLVDASFHVRQFQPPTQETDT